MVSIVCVGTAALDTIALVDRFPREDDRVEAKDLVVAGGGNAATAAVTIARLGLSVEFSGVVGDDEAGETVVEQLALEGVGTDLIYRDPTVRTAQSLVLVTENDGSRAIVTRPSPRPALLPPGFDWIHLDKAGYSALRGGAAGPAKVSLDEGSVMNDLDLSLIDLYVPTLQVLTARFSTSDPISAARAAASAGAGAVVVTDGARGSFALENEVLHSAPALGVKPLSTLGAGDVFHGALLAAVVFRMNLKEAIRFANVAAAISCRGLDGRSGIPSRLEVEEAMGGLPQHSAAVDSTWAPSRA